MQKLLKFYNVLAVLGMAFGMFEVGVMFAHHSYGAMALEFLVVLIWGVFLWVLHLERVFSAELKKSHEELDETLESLMENVKKFAETATANVDGETLKAVTLGLFPDSPPKTEADIARLEAAFHEQTNRFVQIKLESDGLSAQISDEPFEAEKPVKVPVVRSKSEQRRINVGKGYGALTDAEVLNEKNAKRRAARAAKAAK